jgi:hypothetical protein
VTGRALIVRGNALCLPLADETVDLAVLSPPFFGLRDYGTGHPAEVGSEATPAEFLCALWAATAELKRVLKPTGSAFINLGDKYSDRTGGKHDSSDGAVGRGPQAGYLPQTRGPMEKSLLLLPEAYRLGCTGMLATLGGPDPGLNLIARAVIIQSKINGLPESVDDRVRRSHEDWVHLVKNPRYYSALDELRTPYSPKTWTTVNSSHDNASADHNSGHAGHRKSAWAAERGLKREETMHALGAVPGSVWPIASEPLDLPDYLVRLPTGVTMMDAGPLWRHVAWMRATGQPGPVTVRELDHYAAFPSELPRRFILGFSPPGICVDCGHGRFPVVDRAYERTQRNFSDRNASNSDNNRDATRLPYGSGAREQATILGYACACTPSTTRFATEVVEEDETEVVPDGWVNPGPQIRTRKVKRIQYHLAGWQAPPTRPAVVLDPFAGSGTTPMVAAALDRIGIGVELHPDYCLAARWRIRHSRGVAKTLARTNRERQTTLDLVP